MRFNVFNSLENNTFWYLTYNKSLPTGFYTKLTSFRGPYIRTEYNESESKWGSEWETVSSLMSAHFDHSLKKGKTILQT